jgi:hypothetical protein
MGARMRTAFMLAALSTFGCSAPEAPEPESDVADEVKIGRRQGGSKTTLSILVVLRNSDVAHPLVCSSGGEYPGGEELIFENVETKEIVHAVFPQGNPMLGNQHGRFVLCGHFECIRNWDRFSLMRPPEEYQFFVVSSWEVDS